jgi:hypothetical protein
MAPPSAIAHQTILKRPANRRTTPAGYVKNAALERRVSENRDPRSAANGRRHNPEIVVVVAFCRKWVLEAAKRCLLGPASSLKGCSRTNCGAARPDIL